MLEMAKDELTKLFIDDLRNIGKESVGEHQNTG